MRCFQLKWKILCNKGWLKFLKVLKIFRHRFSFLWKFSEHKNPAIFHLYRDSQLHEWYFRSKICIKLRIYPKSRLRSQGFSSNGIVFWKHGDKGKRLEYFSVCFYTLYFFLEKNVLYHNYYVFSKSEREQSREFIHLTISKIRLPVSYVVFESIRKKYRLVYIKSTKANVYFCVGEQRSLTKGIV